MTPDGSALDALVGVPTRMVTWELNLLVQHGGPLPPVTWGRFAARLTACSSSSEFWQAVATMWRERGLPVEQRFPCLAQWQRDLQRAGRRQDG